MSFSNTSIKLQIILEPVETKEAKATLLLQYHIPPSRGYEVFYVPRSCQRSWVEIGG